MYFAYEQLEPQDKILLRRLRGIHDYGWYWKTYQPDRSPLTPAEAGEAVIHPAICTHPTTHWNVIYLSEGCTRNIEGMAEEHGREVVLRYSRFASQFRYTHQWSPGDLVMWDNLAVMHRATEFDDMYDRYMLRTQVEGSTPQQGLALT